MTDDDLDLLHRWNNDPEVLYFSDGPGTAPRSMDEVVGIYCGVCENAQCFIIEVAGEPVGECWLQRMNLPRLIEAHPGQDVRRIDIAIGAKRLWGTGIGTEAVRLLVEFGFERERCDAIYGVGVADYNPRSQRTFERCGFVRVAEIPEPAGSKVKVRYDYRVIR